MVEKKNPDYTVSAISITNPQEIEILLAQRRAVLAQVADFRKTLEKEPTYKKLQEGNATIADIDKELVCLIDEKGGYQDTDAGLYALRQRRISLSYNPKLLREYIPQWAGALISEVVDPKKVGSLIKSKLITETEIEAATIRKETTRVIIQA